MGRHFLRGLACGGLLLLASCSDPKFEKSFNDGFDKGARESCLRSARQGGADDARAQTYCACFIDHMKSWTTQQRMAIDPNSAQFKEVAQVCRSAQ